MNIEPLLAVEFIDELYLGGASRLQSPDLSYARGETSLYQFTQGLIRSGV